MKFKTHLFKNNKYLYCAIRIPHINVNNTILYHFAEHLLFFGLQIEKLGIKNGFQSTNFIYSATAFTDKTSINICFVSPRNVKAKVLKLFNCLEKRTFSINYSILQEQKAVITEEIINRQNNPYFYWRDIILKYSLENSQINFNAAGELDQISRISEKDLRNYIFNDDLSFSFYYSIGNIEHYSIAKKTEYLWFAEQKSFLINSRNLKKLSIVTIVPVFTKEDYIYAQIYSDYLFNINDSVVVKHLLSNFKISDAHLESELYDNFIIYHFTTQYNDNVESSEIINSLNQLFSERISIESNEIQKRLLRQKCLISFTSFRRLYSTYLRLFKLQNNHFLLNRKNYDKVDVDSLCKKIKMNIHKFNNMIDIQ